MAGRPAREVSFMKPSARAGSSSPHRSYGNWGALVQRLALFLAALWTAFVVAAVLPGIASAQQPIKIVALGDSLTAGYQLPESAAFPSQLARALQAKGHKVEIVNAGVSGDTTAGGLRRVDWALRLRPEIVLLELGANDALRGHDLTRVRSNLEAMITRFEAGGAKVLLLGMRLPPNYGGRYAGEFARIYEDVARQRKLALMPFFLDGVGAVAALNQPDGIHPTAEGYRIIVDRLWPHLRPLLSR